VLATLKQAWPNARVVGYDISQDAVRLARELHQDVDVRLGDATESGEHFDLVLLVDVFEHVEDYLGFLRRVAPLGALMVFHVPLDMNALLVARERTMMASRSAYGHLHYFSKATALATLEDAGYTVLATKYTPGSMELPNRSWRMKVAKWPRRLGFRISPDATARILGGYSLLVLARPTQAEGCG
jgi:cyclopropane fatty-acyl-phospholipid synthase-like methyltransferase